MNIDSNAISKTCLNAAARVGFEKSQIHTQMKRGLITDQIRTVKKIPSGGGMVCQKGKTISETTFPRV